MDRGEVWWADLPPPVGRRPVLILSRSSSVRARNQVVVAQITRTVHGIPSEVALDKSDGMPRRCVVNTDVLLTVAKSRPMRRITRLNRSRIAGVAQALHFALDLP